MRRALSRVCLAALLLVCAAETARAEFNPEGRGKKRPAGATPPVRPGPPKPRPPAPAAAGSSPAGAKPASDASKPPDKPKEAAGPSSEALIARYTGIVLAQPGADFPLQRLIELYRERDGKLDALIADLEQRAGQGGATRYAALIARAGIEKFDGHPERAQASYERAIGEDPKNAIGILALARMLQERGDKTQARQRFEQALPAIKDDAEREQVLRTLLGLCLDLKDYDAAKRAHEELVKRANGSFFVRAELGRELLGRGEYQRAAAEYKLVVRAASGDNRVLAPALRDYGKALAKLGKTEEALTELRRARDLAGESGVRREVGEAIVEIYRAEERLPQLIAELEKQGGGQPDGLRTLGALYEETGQVEKAIATYRRVLQSDAKDLATRMRVVHLLEVRGDLDQAIAEYDALIRAAPRNPDFVFRLAEALISRGDRKRALERLQELEARSGNDEETLTALVDFYERVEEKPRALALLQRLAAGGSADPEHLVELGTRYWQEGDKKKALATWQRIKLVVPDRARALSTLGELYLEHDMPAEALQALSEAMKLAPKQLRYRKAYALALERSSSSTATREQRSAQFDEARKIWEQLLREASSDANLAREARQHIVSLWSLDGQLAARIPALESKLKQTPPDLEAGRLLGEANFRLRRYADAERVLRRVTDAAPSDVESLLALERVLGLEHKLKDAIAVLDKLTHADPKRAREYYQRMASDAAELYHDDEAVSYAARAVELSPDDAEGHKKLGEMYRKRQDVRRSIAEFRQAISKNDRLFPVYLELAELLLGEGSTDEADLLLRRVIRASPDEELVSQAARLSMQVNLGKGTLESLERDLLPLALNSPERGIYRQLLLEIYGAMAYPLLEQAKSADPHEADAARAALDRVGERAVKPLLDALSDARESSQEVAISLLGHVRNKSAGPALFSYATGTQDPTLRARAMIAVGMLRDPALLPRSEALLLASGHAVADDADPVVLAAAWGVTRLRAPRAQALLSALADSDAPNLSALGWVGLGALGARAALPKIERALENSAKGPLPRAAAAFALGELGRSSQGELLEQLAHGQDPTLRSAALLALARQDAPNVARAIADALVSGDPSVAAAAADAALVWSTHDYRRPRDLLPAPAGLVDVRAVLDGLRPAGYGKEERSASLDKLVPALSEACVAAAQASPERARAVAELLLGDSGKPPFGALLDPSSSAQALAHAAELSKKIGAELVPTFVRLSQHLSVDVRLFALHFLAGRDEDAARAALVGALGDARAEVRRAALGALGPKDASARPAVARVLRDESDWALRAAAADALGRIAEKTDDTATFTALEACAGKDPYAIVREAALPALVRVNPARARAVLTRSHDTDPEPRVKARAAALLDELR